jgi:hypothetical protein
VTSLRLSDLLEHNGFIMPIGDGPVASALLPGLKAGAFLIDYLGHVKKLALV